MRQAIRCHSVHLNRDDLAKKLTISTSRSSHSILFFKSSFQVVDGSLPFVNQCCCKRSQDIFTNI